MTSTPGRRRRPRIRKVPEPPCAPAPAGGPGPAPASAVQLAIGLLTASLDSPELEEWAAWALVPEEPEALATVIAGLHLVSLNLLRQLHDAAGQPPASTLQKLALEAAAGPETPLTG